MTQQPKIVGAPMRYKVMYRSINCTTRYEAVYFDTLKQARAYVKKTLKAYNSFKRNDSNTETELIFTGCILID